MKHVINNGKSKLRNKLKKKTKDDLMKWQEKTKYGLSLGRYKKDGRANGTLTHPSFNLKVIQEE